MSYPWDMTYNGGFVNGYGFPDAGLPALLDRAAARRRPLAASRRESGGVTTRNDPFRSSRARGGPGRSSSRRPDSTATSIVQPLTFRRAPGRPPLAQAARILPSALRAGGDRSVWWVS